MRLGACAGMLVPLLLAGCGGPSYALQPCPADAQPEPCSGRISEADAIAIARAAGLGPGIKAWETSFHYYFGEIDGWGPGYIWSVSNTTFEDSDPKAMSFAAGGDAVLIEGATGRVVEHSSWSAVS